MLPPVPTAAQVRALPAPITETVVEDDVDDNGHMNITVYFRNGAWAPWLHVQEHVTGADYLAERGLSFFTVEHRLRYLGELRLGERYSVRPGFAARTDKAVHLASFVLDEQRDRVACVMEILYVHVSLETRRAVPIPDDVAAALDVEITAQPWVADVATGLTLRR